MNKITTAAISAAIIVVSLPAIAQTNGTPPPPTPSPQINLACIQTAVDAREQSIGAAFSAFSTTESAALTARASALHTAWAITDATARRAARSAAWSTYTTANRSAFSTLRAARKAAWSAFATASKACHTAVVETPSTEGTGSLGL